MKKLMKKLKTWITKRKTERIIRKKCKVIYKATGIHLCGWQLDYVFRGGPYQSEAKYGRRNGKTIANILKIIFSPDHVIFVNKLAWTIELNGPHEVDTMHFMKEDSCTRERRRYFIEEMLDIYRAISDVVTHKQANEWLCLFVDEDIDWYAEQNKESKRKHRKQRRTQK